MTHTEKFAVTLNDEGYLVVTTKSGEGYRLFVAPGKPLIFTNNAAVTQGLFMNSQGIIHKTTPGKPNEAWDDGETLYIKVRGGYVTKYSLTTGRKLQD